MSCRVKRVDTTGGLRPGGVKPVEATVMMVDARRGQVMTGEENRDRSGDDQTMMKTGEEKTKQNKTFTYCPPSFGVDP